jgi:hypothetical protein
MVPFLCEPDMGCHTKSGIFHVIISVESVWRNNEVITLIFKKRKLATDKIIVSLIAYVAFILKDNRMYGDTFLKFEYGNVSLEFVFIISPKKQRDIVVM